MSWVENFLKINNQGGGGDVFSIKEKFKTRIFSSAKQKLFSNQEISSVH